MISKTQSETYYQLRVAGNAMNRVFALTGNGSARRKADKIAKDIAELALEIEEEAELTQAEFIRRLRVAVNG